MGRGLAGSRAHARAGGAAAGRRRTPWQWAVPTAVAPAPRIARWAAARAAPTQLAACSPPKAVDAAARGAADSLAAGRRRRQVSGGGGSAGDEDGGDWERWVDRALALH